MDLVATACRNQEKRSRDLYSTRSQAAKARTKHEQQGVQGVLSGWWCGWSGRICWTALCLLDEASVDLNLVARTAGATGTALILVSDRGENMIATVLGANGTINEKQARNAVDAMEPDDILMLQLEIPPIAVEAALRTARSKGVTTSSTRRR